MALSISPLDAIYYPSSTWDDQIEVLFSAARGDKAAVIKDAGGFNMNLQVTGTASPASVAAGQCLVKGKRAVNTSTITINIPTPASNPRIDRVVLRFVFATGVLSVERIAGVEGATPAVPAVTQIDGNTWEVPLASVQIATNGAMVVTNERMWALPRGIFKRGEMKWGPFLLGGPGSKYLWDAELGGYDPEWALADGETYNGYVTVDMRGRMALAASASYVSGTAYGSSSVSLNHRHQMIDLLSNIDYLHTHTINVNSGDDTPQHAHLYAGIELVSSGSTYLAVMNGQTTGPTVPHHHLVVATTNSNSGHSHKSNGYTEYATLTSVEVLSPCMALGCFQYVPLQPA